MNKKENSIIISVIAVFLSLSGSLLKSQSKVEQSPAQAIYGELLGPGGFYSINYDRRIFNRGKKDGFGLRAGIALVSPVLTIPTELYYLLGRRHYLDVGIGITFATGTIDVADGPTKRNNASFYTSVKYRFQALDNGLFFSIGGSYFPDMKFFDDKMSFWPSAGIGIGF